MAKKSFFSKLLTSVAKDIFKTPKVSKIGKQKSAPKTIEYISSTQKKVTTKSLEKYIKGAVIDPHTLDLLTNATLSGKKSVIVEQSLLNELEEGRKRFIFNEKEWKELMNRKAKAKAYEKSGKLEQAVSTYKDLIVFGIASQNLTITHYGYDVNRLRIVLNKLKRKDEFTEFLNEHNISI
ncbi:hypothetical protein [Dyadobacter sp. LHD-138]|uniref:hypothetical protein n=1 Tax=Dyadobacter sp. LHD-138 TaxID=3071413 RepID=UPI0027E003FB|nr:hypothetical protein [Dyadobacter sp. LHD-138]MDQ6477844.1 hypothetical protein [Dyadobacter sp. LHD-138]